MFTAAKVSALLGLAAFGFARAEPAGNRREFRRQFLAQRRTRCAARGSGGCRWADRDGGHTNDPCGCSGGISVLGGCLEQRDFTAGEVKNPSRNLPLSLALGTGVVIALYIACNFIYMSALPLEGVEGGATILARGINTRLKIGLAPLS